MDTKGETQDGMNWDIEMDTYATDTMYKIDRASQVVLVNPPPMLVDVRDLGSIPGSGKSPGGGHGNHSSIFAWRIPWTEEPGRL